MRAVIWRLTAFVTVCVVAMFVILAIFAQLRFDETTTYTAEFTNVSGLEEGNFVRIAGVEVGKVKHISVRDDAVAVVEFTADPTVVLDGGTRAAVRYADLLGARYLSLDEADGDPRRLAANQTIPVSHTEPALDLDALIGGFRPLFRALDPDQVNALTGQLINAFQGQGDAISSVLLQVGQLTTTLAGSGQTIKDVIDNLSTVVGSFATQSNQLDEGIGSITRLVTAFSERKSDVSDAVAHADAVASSLADLLQRARPGLKETIVQTDRSAGIVVADHDYVDDLLKTLPDSYRSLSRQGIYGDFFTFYACSIMLKVNGKGGQPVYVKIADQVTGRCEPK